MAAPTPSGERRLAWVVGIGASLMVLLVAVIGVSRKEVARAKEIVLKNNLYTLRTVIDNYTYDKGRVPGSLHDLVTEGYLSAIPIDPMTESPQVLGPGFDPVPLFDSPPCFEQDRLEHAPQPRVVRNCRPEQGWVDHHTPKS